MDVPSPQAGTISSIAVSAGDKVSEGHIILALDSDGASPAQESSVPVAEPTVAVASVSASEAETVMIPFTCRT